MKTFAPGWQFVLDPDGTLEFVPASQPSPLLLRRGQVSEIFSGGSFPVGLLEEASFTASRIQLEPGDIIIMLDGQPLRSPEDVRAHFAETTVQFLDIKTGKIRLSTAYIP